MLDWDPRPSGEWFSSRPQCSPTMIRSVCLQLIFLLMRKAKKGKAGHIEGDYGKNGWDKLICCRYLILNLVMFLLRDDVPANQFGGAAVGPLIDYALCSLGAHSRQA